MTRPTAIEIELTADSLNNDFGNAHTITDECGDEARRCTTSATTRSACQRVTRPSRSSTCSRPGLKSWATEAKQIVNFHPVPGQCDDCGTASTVEKLTWDIPNTQTSVLGYDDDLLTRINPVPTCSTATRSARGGGDFGLRIPSRTARIRRAGGQHTSCLIQSTEKADGTREDWVYSEIDGYRTLD